MPTIDKTFLLKLLLVLGGFTGGLFGLHAIQASRIPDALLRQADRATADGKPDAAVRHLRQYLEFRPDDTDARERLADLLRDRPEAAHRDLRHLYDHILRADPDRKAVRREAVKLALRNARFTDAEGHAEAYLKQEPADAEVWQMLAAARAALRKFGPAREAYEAAVSHAPADPIGYQRLAQFLWRDMDNPIDARAVIDRMVAALPNAPDGYLTRVRFAQMSTDPAAPVPPRDADPVLADALKAVAVAPTHPDARLLLAERLQRHRDLHAAAASLAEGVKHHPGDGRLVRALAWLEVNRGNTAGAMATLEDGIPHAKDPLDLLVPLADLLLQSGDTAKADEIARKLEGRKGPVARLQAVYLRGRLAMRQQQWADAVRHLTALRAAAVELPGLETQANLLLATCYQKTGEPAKELDTLKLITAKDPLHLAARTALASAHLSAGRPADAVREYEAAVASPFAPGNVAASLIQTRALMLAAANAPADAWAQLDKQLIELAPRFGPNAAEPVMLRADVLNLAGRTNKAVELLRKEVGRRPGDVRVWAKLAAITADAEGVAAGLGVLDEAQGLLADGAELRLARADLYARDPARLRPVERLEAQADGWPDAEQVRLLYGLIDVYDRIGRPAEVLRLYKRLAARRPTETAVWLTLADRSIRANDTATAAEAASVLAKLEGADGPGGALVAAWQAIAADAPAGPAREQLTHRFTDAPDRADACLALARLYRKEQNQTDASRLFARAAALEPLKFEPAVALMGDRAANADGDGLKRLCDRLAADPRWSGEPFRRAVAVVAGTSKANAQRVLAAAAPHLERQPGGFGFLADVCHAGGLTAEVLGYCQRALAAPIATADDWLRLAVRHPGTDLKSKTPLSDAGQAAFAAALAETPAGKDAEPTFDTLAARRAFTQARLAILLARTDRTRAVTVLDGYLKTPSLPAADTGWATRNLAMLLVVRGEPADRKRAVELLAKTTDDTAETLADKRATAAALSTLVRYLEGDDRQAVLTRAMAVMTDVATASGAPRDEFALVQLLQAANQPDAAVDKLNGLLAKDPANVDFLLAGLGVLLDAGRADKARGFADRLMNVAPTEFRAVAAVARFECKTGHPEKALALADGYARSADPLSGDVFAKNARAADLLGELAQTPPTAGTPAGRAFADAAVARYEASIANRVELVTSAAGLLAADGRPAEAFARIERHSRALPARVKAAAGVTVLRAAGGSDRQFELVRKWLDAARDEQPHAAGVWLAEAEYRGLKQDYAGAETAYTEVLNRDPRNVTALNNLAWLLAADPKQADRALELIDRAAKETGLTGELLDTRARVRIAARQPVLAESDAAEALKQAKTPLRYFHLALARNDQGAERATAAAEAFRSAKDRGLDSRQVHPADRGAYQTFESGMK